MPLPHEQFLAALTRLSKEQIRQAGHRYTPGIDPQAPNLRIAPLFSAIQNVACGASALARFETALKELSNAWGGAKHCSQKPDDIQAHMDDAHASLAPMIGRLRTRDTRAVEEWVQRLAGLEADLLADVDHWRAEEEKLPAPQGEVPYSSAREEARRNMNAAGRCLEIVREEKEYTATEAFRVLCDPQLLLSGEWGTGKTHLLCDITQERIGLGQATVLILAKNFQGRVLSEILECIEPSRAPELVLDQLQETARRLGERALVIIDGVNEGRRREWRRAISALRALVSSRPEVGLIISCRTPFEQVAIARKDVDRLHRIEHQGFDDQEFDAQAAFFQYYKLPLPEVPLLDREFSRPLTLKLICQSLRNLTGKKLAQGFAGIASGQKGMTYVLESLVNEIGKPVEAQFGLAPKGCWSLLKGSEHVADRRHAGFAPCMASSLRGYVRPSEADRILAANCPHLSRTTRRNLLEALRTSGLIDEDAILYTSKSGFKSRFVLRLPYQRFSDHLIARHLLKEHLDVSSIRAIRQSFSPTSPLGHIFSVVGHHQRMYFEPGWAQALITEFPERAGTRLRSKKRELFFVLPRDAQDLTAYFEPFVEGLFWRDPASFTEGTRFVINQYLNGGQQDWERVVDALAAVSTKPEHPYHARRLHRYLAQFTMADRDLKWSEYLRREHASPTIRRLLAWASKLNTASMSEPVAKELVVLLSLVLTTVVRSDRDLATKALVLIGERFPKALFDHVVTGFEFNDPYVSERLLAAAYGVTLSLVDSEEQATFRLMLGKLAKTLYEGMFGPRAKYATHHALRRDYALGVIEIAQRVRCVTLPSTAGSNLTSPYPQIESTFEVDGAPDARVTEAIGHAIHMDFGNYTIGSLIPDRANYDDKNLNYVRVRAQIERRIYDLGYRKERFESIDQSIGNESFRVRDVHKVDRFGKKYSWIAYFEMWGERDAAGELPDWRLGERTPDCDLDPTFPKPPPNWAPPIPELFGDRETDTEAWVEGGFTPAWKPLLVVPEINGHQGDWVLVQGYVRGVKEDLDRELQAFLRGAFVARRDMGRLKDRFLAIDYPGNSAIPDGDTEHYLFAGEAGRRNNYTRHLLRRNGWYRRQIQEAFDRYVTVERPALRTRHIPGIRVELPSIHFGWESHHSALNDFSGFDLPAPALIQRLGLASKSRQVDFFDADGNPGTLYREAGDGWKGNRHRLLYIRADLLRRYLIESRQVLAWCNWGERDWARKVDGAELIDNPARQRIYQTYRHIHRSFSYWPS
jgi:hypothetical protein